MALLLDTDVVATCEAIRTLAVHEAWFCANTRSLCFDDAKQDREKADAAFKRLKDLLPFELAYLLRKLAEHSSWYAANTRRLLLLDAWRDEKVWKESCAALRSKLAPELAEALELTFLHVAWHAANVRTYFWNDALSDDKQFQEALLRLQPLMRTVQMEEREKQREADRLKESQAEKPQESRGHEQPLASGHGPSCFAGKLEGGREQPPTSGQDTGCFPWKLPGSSGHEQSRSSDHGPGCFAFGVRLGMLVGWQTKGEEDITLNPPRATPCKASVGLEFEVLEHERLPASSFTLAGASSPCTSVCSLPESPSLCCSMSILGKTEMAWRAVVCNQEGVTTTAFLAAASATADIFGSLGSVVSKVKDDIQGNIAKIQKNVDIAESSSTLEQIVDGELAAAESPSEATKEGSTSLALLWLGRMLRLVAKMIAEIDNSDTKPLSQCIQAGYDSCLSQHHPWAVRMAMGVAIRGCPSRQTFFDKIGSNPANVQADAKRLHEVMSLVLGQIQTFMVSRGLEKNDL